MMMPRDRGELEEGMSMYRPGLFGRDAALRARQRMERRMERRSKRRLAKHLLQRNAQWRRALLKTMAAGLAAVLAGQLLFGEMAAAAQPAGEPLACQGPWGIKANGAVCAAGAIRAGESLQAGEEIRAGEGYGVFAGLAVQQDRWDCSAQVRASARPHQLLSGHWVEAADG